MKSPASGEVGDFMLCRENQAGVERENDVNYKCNKMPQKQWKFR